VAIFPNSPKRIKKVLGWLEEKQEHEAMQVLHDLLKLVLHPLSNSARDGYNIKCGDEVVRRCYFRVAGWLADHMENSTIHGIYTTRCTICESAQDRLGNLQKYPLRDAQQYWEWVNKSDTESLHMRGVKYIRNALWTLRDVIPWELVRSDILHTILLGNLQHLLDWIKEFLESHDRLNAFDSIWSSMAPYPGNYVLRKSYQLLSQVSGKEMRSILMVILGVFTASLRRKTNAVRPPAGQEQDFRKAITCVRYLTDFALLSRYRSHTDSTIGYMEQYLQQFHKTKDVFLRYRAGKVAKAKADMVSKELNVETTARKYEEKANGHTACQKARALAEDREECVYLVNQALVEDSHFNFPKIYLLMHWSDQISQYGSLLQFSTEICKALHKALKEAYCRSNHIDSIPQIIQGYSRAHNIAVKELEIEAWAVEIPDIKKRVKGVLRPKRTNNVLIIKEGTRMFMTLRGKQSIKEIYNIVHIAEAFMIPDLARHMKHFLEWNACQAGVDQQSDAERILLHAMVEAYNSLEIPVPDQDVDADNTYKVQHLRITGRKGWRGGEPRRDTVWVHVGAMRLCPASAGRRSKCYRGRVVGYLNALFTLLGTNRESFKLAHVTFLDWVGNPTPHGTEGMSRVEAYTGGGGQSIVWLSAIEGAVHLIPLEPERNWIVNNRVDYHVWNEMNDG